MEIKFDKYDDILDISSLEESPFQRNVHSKEQIKALAKVMKEDGVRQAIHVVKGTKRICYGHGRRAAAKLNKWKKFPIVYQDVSNAEQEYRIVQSDNGLGQWSELDLKQINLDLESIGPFDPELLGIKGFVLDPNFKPGTLEEQGKLDELEKVIMECPHCKESFEKREAKVID